LRDVRPSKILAGETSGMPATDPTAYGIQSPEIQVGAMTAASEPQEGTCGGRES
jgi:hypothetical protein